MSYMKLLKLLYLADRQALLELGRPITFDRFVAMPHGPVLSRTCDLITSEPDPLGPTYWGRYISAPSNYEVGLLGEVPNDQLSPAEEAILDSVGVALAGSRDELSAAFERIYQLVRRIHSHIVGVGLAQGTDRDVATSVDELAKTLGEYEKEQAALERAERIAEAEIAEVEHPKSSGRKDIH